MSAADAKAKLPSVGGPVAVNEQNEGPVASPLTPSAAGKTKARLSVKAVIETWAAGLHAKNAPDAKTKGPLAWVREVEVGKLIAALEKEGFR